MSYIISKAHEYGQTIYGIKREDVKLFLLDLPYVFDIDKQRQVTYVVNLADARESDLAPLETITWSKREVTATAKALKENREFWLWPALLALGLVMLEWYVYNRRVYI